MISELESLYEEGYSKFMLDTLNSQDSIIDLFGMPLKEEVCFQYKYSSDKDLGWIDPDEPWTGETLVQGEFNDEDEHFFDMLIPAELRMLVELWPTSTSLLENSIMSGVTLHSDGTPGTGLGEWYYPETFISVSIKEWVEHFDLRINDMNGMLNGVYKREYYNFLPSDIEYQLKQNIIDFINNPETYSWDFGGNIGNPWKAYFLYFNEYDILGNPLDPLLRTYIDHDDFDLIWVKEKNNHYEILDENTWHSWYIKHICFYKSTYW